ncbi:gamma-glutamylcyclotransferase family protein [Pelagibius sp. Alg239-R121]|uniref:gamma-glutamylcyclotransferase family protein n=1 Tax=Pelagibius sp. Alg239-R121 TaxID=2993448 RepID=UPI0024A78885|nr:gamma-glutamylcyclotransferase family protein [Pelagibius sp. Alg239-R121]
MSERKLEVFFYGLFMDREALLTEGYHPGPAVLASLSGYALHIGQRATLVPSSGRTAWGMMMALPAGEIERLYSGASVSAYRPEAVLVKSAEGTPVPALCYNLMRLEESAPNRDYARKLAAVAARLALPEVFIAEIERFSQKP